MGTLKELKKGIGKSYAEKIMVVDSDRETPMHFHWAKTEDIHQPRRRTTCHPTLQFHCGWTTG